MENKSIKVTNKQQFQKLVDLVEQNPDIGRGKVTFGSNKNDLKAKWNEFSEELNSLRPPVRTGNEWQRVWIHLKAKTKKKLANNRRNILATGGGPSEEIPLSPLEESIANLVDMKRQIVPEGRAFGIENVDPSPNISVPVSEQVVENGTESNTTQATPRQKIIKKCSSDQERLELLKKQTKTQEKVLEKISKLEKTCYKQYMLSKEKFEFKKRKAAAEEELLKVKLEYQRKKIAKLEMELV